MKRIISLIAILIVCISLCACGKSKEATMVDELVLNIGEVSLESRNVIETARNSYDALTEDQKKEVENLEILISAEETLRTLVAELVENAKTAAKYELLNYNPNAAIKLLEKVLPMDSTVQNEIDIIYGHCFDLNNKLFIKPSLLYTHTELIGVSLNDSEHKFDSYYFSPVDTDDFMDYCEYATQEFTLDSKETLESAYMTRYQFLDTKTGDPVLRLSVFAYNGVATLGVETIPQTRIHIN